MGGGAGALTRPCDVDAISSVGSVEKHTMLQQQSGDGDDMKTTDGQQLHERAMAGCGDAGTALETFVLGISQSWGR